VRSEVGVGTSFEIYLPSLGHPAGLPRQGFTETPLYDAGGSECVLIVDDEHDVLSYIKDTLDSHGYKTFATDNPMYAQELFSEMAVNIDLVITDMVMPLVNGADLSRQFKAQKPALKVIGVSGFSGGTIAQAATDIDVLIKKPLDGVMLLTTVRQLLDRKADSEN
jgi:two-component system cell cycle sensor histidine kinase/response regulator CckA